MPFDPLQKRRTVSAGAPAQDATPGTGAPAAAMPATPAPAQRQGTGFVSFDRILSANRQGAQSMANQVADKVQGAAQGAEGAIQGGQNAFDKKVAAGTLTYDQNRPGLTSKEAQTLSGTTYTGPKTWQEAGVDTGAIASQVVKASGQVAALKSGAGGVASLLRESYKSPAYGAGSSALDGALAGAAGGQRFQELAAKYGDLGQRLASAMGDSGKAYEAAVSATKDAAAKYGAMVPGLQDAEAKAAEEAHLRAIQEEQQAEWERNSQRRGVIGRDVADEKRGRGKGDGRMGNTNVTGLLGGFL